MKTVNSFSLITLSLLVLFACSRENNTARIVGKIKNLETDTVLFSLTSFQDDPTYIFDTIVSHNGNFIIDTLINELHFGTIITPEMFSTLDNGMEVLIRSKAINFFIEPKGELKIDAVLLPELTEYVLMGLELNSQQNIYWEDIKVLLSEDSRLMFEYENLFYNDAPSSVIDDYEKSLGETSVGLRKVKSEFIKQHPDFELSVFLLLQNRKDTIQKYYRNFDDAVKGSSYGKLIEQKIASWSRISVGETAPDFEYQTLNEITFRLSDYKDRYIVLDFWGSWCAPCIGGFPAMKQFYNEHKQKVEFVGIACRDQKENWISAVKEYGLDWIQILNQNGENDLSKIFAVEGYPTKIIINPEGNIEGIYLGESEEFYLKLDELLNLS
ncbi:MAG: TlpA family protein disulfide reductase [Bacteroidales bacterium]|nr:TlpA family protein disulfide reductase [Bacteroidales bacterium]